MPIRKTKVGFTATYGGVTKNFKTRDAAEKWSARYKNSDGYASLTGSKRKAKRTSKRGKRRLYT